MEKKDFNNYGRIDLLLTEYVSNVSEDRRGEIEAELGQMNVNIELELREHNYVSLDRAGGEGRIFIRPITEVIENETKKIIKIRPEVSHVNAVRSAQGKQKGSE